MVAIRAAIREILDNGAYRADARRVSREMKSLPGLDYAVALLERLAIEKKPIHAQRWHPTVPGANGRSREAHVRKSEIYATGLLFGECPRWHDDRLWVSDFHRHQVLTIDSSGNLEPVVDVPNQPSGLGWLPDGRLLVVSMLDRKLLRLDPTGLVEHADLSHIATFHCNDMVVDANGRAYVGNFGFDLDQYVKTKDPEYTLIDPELVTATMARVDPDGTIHPVADELRFPNGTVITPDGSTLIVGETCGARLTAFDMQPDGSLQNRRTWASLEQDPPDGICLDAEGCIWVAIPIRNECIRVAEGGEIVDRVMTSAQCYACALGGPDRKTLFLTTNVEGQTRHGTD